MTDFPIHTQNSAPEKSKPILDAVQQAYGFIPNLMATFAESPAAVEAYTTLSSIFGKSDLSPTEQQVILMTNNRLNGCAYCMAAHTTISKMQRLPDDVIEALRKGESIADEKLEALRVFAAKVNTARGFVPPADVEAFLAAGYTKANVLEVILGTSLKVLSNYTNHVANTPVDEAFQGNAWTPEHSHAA